MIRKLVPHFSIFALVSILYLFGGLEFIEFKLMDARFQLSERDASENLVLVDVDPASLNEIGVWPWPRGLYAVALDTLLTKGARRVAFDIDFSAPSVLREDQMLQRALARSKGKTILPLFKRALPNAGGDTEFDVSRPLPLFGDHARLAFINVQPETDGFIRRMIARESLDGEDVMSLSFALLGLPLRNFEFFYIDYGIRLSAVPRIPFVDILRGTFDSNVVKGKQVIIGATAIELGDQLAVPVYQSAAGMMVQALAYESLAQGRALSRLAPLPVLTVALLLALFLGPGFDNWGWRRGGAIVLLTGGGAFGLSVAVQSAWPVMIDVTPWVLTVLLIYSVAVVRYIDQQGLRLIFQGIEIRRKDTMMRNVVENSFVGIIIMDEHGIVETVNPAVLKMFDCLSIEIVGHHLGKYVSEMDEQSKGSELVDFLKPGQGMYEMEGRDKSGRNFPMEVEITEARVDHHHIFTAFIRDITERYRQKTDLEYQALHDSLTGLPNRTLFFNRLEHAIMFARRSQKPLAVLLIDLDRFKILNDTLGHHIGDLLLQQVGLHLRAQVRDSDTVARLGGDEFALLLPEISGLLIARQLSEKILKSLEQPFVLEQLEFEIGASIGIAMYPDHGDGAARLVQMADTAMYVAKQEQTGFSVYDSENDHHSVRHLTLIGDLRRAIEEDHLVLHYQPKVDMSKNRIYGVEALVRWNHPDHGLLLPDEFIGPAEQTGLIKPLTLWVLETAARQFARWQINGIQISIAVNLSARNLQDMEFPNAVDQIVQQTGIDVGRLTLEVTESAIMGDPVRAMKVIKALDDRGVRLSIDDFGTGYSSLAYLKDLPADELKIDKSFVLNMLNNENNKMIVESTIGLAHNLGMKVVAEGIESRETGAALADLKCDMGQGYLYAHPLPIDDFNAIMAKASWRPLTNLVRHKTPAE